MLRLANSMKGPLKLKESYLEVSGYLIWNEKIQSNFILSQLLGCSFVGLSGRVAPHLNVQWRVEGAVTRVWPMSAWTWSPRPRWTWTSAMRWRDHSGHRRSVETLIVTMQTGPEHIQGEVNIICIIVKEIERKVREQTPANLFEGVIAGLSWFHFVRGKVVWKYIHTEERESLAATNNCNLSSGTSSERSLFQFYASSKLFNAAKLKPQSQSDPMIAHSSSIWFETKSQWDNSHLKQESSRSSCYVMFWKTLKQRLLRPINDWGLPTNNIWHHFRETWSVNSDVLSTGDWSEGEDIYDNDDKMMRMSENITLDYSTANEGQHMKPLKWGVLVLVVLVITGFQL